MSSPAPVGGRIVIFLSLCYHKKIVNSPTERSNVIWFLGDQHKAQALGRAGDVDVQPPHDPYVGPSPWPERHTPSEIALRPNVPGLPRTADSARRDLAGDYALIENLDANLGCVRERLQQRGLLADTHLLFFSGHGDSHGSRGISRESDPCEESPWVPMIFGGLEQTCDAKRGEVPALVSDVDLAPARLGLADIDPPSWMVGRDLSGLRLRSRRTPELRDSAYCHLVRGGATAFSVASNTRCTHSPPFSSSPRKRTSCGRYTGV